MQMALFNKKPKNTKATTYTYKKTIDDEIFHVPHDNFSYADYPGREKSLTLTILKNHHEEYCVIPLIKSSKWNHEWENELRSKYGDNFMLPTFCTTIIAGYYADWLRGLMPNISFSIESDTEYYDTYYTFWDAITAYKPMSNQADLNVYLELDDTFIEFNKDFTFIRKGKCLSEKEIYKDGGWEFHSVLYALWLRTKECYNSPLTLQEWKDICK